MSSVPLHQPVQWFAHHSLGQQVLLKEQQLLKTLYPQLFGFHLLQVGGIGQGQLIQGSRIGHHCLVSVPELPGLTGHFGVQAEADALATDSVDVVLVPHVLEFAEHPHGVLREVERVLIAEGYVILLGFNRGSWWGMWHLFRRWRDVPPWNAKLLGLNRIKDWLSLLGFEIISQQTCFFAPPFQNQRLVRNLTWMETLGKRWLPLSGGVYVVLAQKRRLHYPSVRPRWRLRQKKDKGLIGAATPTANSPTTRSSEWRCIAETLINDRK